MKNIFIVAAMLSPLYVSAAQNLEFCDYESEKGREFTFLQADEEMLFLNRMGNVNYPYIVNDKFKPKPVLVDKYSYRQGKLNEDSFFRRDEKNPDGSHSSIRYYEAKIENCDTVWFRISEEDSLISRYMNKENAVMTGNVPWDLIDKNLSIKFQDTYYKLKSLKGKNLTVLPVRDNLSFFGKSIDIQKDIEIKDFSKLKILKVTTGDFVRNGIRKGSIQIKVMLNNQEVLIPWDPERLAMENPFNNKKIRKEYYANIKNEKIKFGMNIDEVILAWGQPDTVKYLDIYEEQRSKELFIKNLEFPYGDNFSKMKSSSPIKGIKKGHYFEIFYKNRLRDGESLKFNENGILLEENQTKNLHKNEIHKPVALR